MGHAIGSGPKAHGLGDLEPYISPPLIRVQLPRTNQGKKAPETSRETQPLAAKRIG